MRIPRDACLAVLVVCVSFEAQVVGAGAPKLSEIEVRLLPSKTEIAFGETLTLAIQVTNRSERRLNLALSSHIGQGVLDLVGLRIGPPGEASHTRPMNAFYTLTSDAVVLEPKGTVKLSYSWFYLPHGRHTLKAVYEYKNDAAGEGFDGLWRGKAQSESVVIRVGPITPKAREAFGEFEHRVLQLLPGMHRPAKLRLLAAVQRYMPLSKVIMRALLRDKDPMVVATTLNAVGLIADADYCREVKWPHDVSLLPEVLAMAKSARHPRVRATVANALEMGRKSLTGEQRRQAITVLKNYMNDPNPLIGGRATTALFKIDRRTAVDAVTEKMQREQPLDERFRQMLIQALLKETGKVDVKEALEALRKSLEEEQKKGGAPPKPD